jgi:Concanavalin A-like lectin/glucanases superfamily
MTRNRLTAVLAVAVGALGLPASAHASYAEQVLADDPLTYLRLDEASGATVAQDASPNDRDGLYLGAPALGVDGPFDEAGDAAGLAASDSISATVAEASGSIELWVNPNRLAKGQEAGIASHGDPDADGWAVGIGARRKLTFASRGAKVASKVTLSSNVWTLLTVTWHGTKVDVYRDGTLARSLNRGSALPVSSGAELVLGSNGAGEFTGRFAGRMDEVALYSEALSAADIKGRFETANVPVNTAPPTIDDQTPDVGQTLTAQPGTWEKGGTAGYQWQRCDKDGEDCEDIVGATGTSYLVGAGEACGTIQVAVTMTNASGSATAFSEPTGTVAGACGTTVPENTEPPGIDDQEPVVGDALTVTAGTWSDIGTPSYQWQRCDEAGGNCEDIADANETAYDVRVDDACSTIRVVETMTNPTGAGMQESAATAPVICAPGNTTPPVIVGTAAVGLTVRAEPGVWDDGGGATYQWQHCDADGANCVDIDGATGTDYMVAADDACGTLRVTETMTNSTGQDTAISAAGSVVAPCDTDPGDGGGGRDGGGGGGGGSAGGGTGGPGGGGTGAGAGPGSAPVVQSPAPAGCLKLVAARKRMKVRRLGMLRLAAAAKNACFTAPLGASFKARKGVKLRSVVYKLDGRKLERVKRKGFRARLVPAKLAAGTHTLTVRVRPSAGKAKSVKLRIRTAIA